MKKVIGALLFFAYPLYGMELATRSPYVDAETQTDDFLLQSQLKEVDTPSSSDSDKPPIPLTIEKPSSEAGSNNSLSSPDAKATMELEFGKQKGCFKCRCKMKFKRMAQVAGAGTTGTVLGIVIALLAL